MAAPAWLPQYDALIHHAGLVALRHRTQIEIAGPDCRSFLHNLCTNEIRKLPAGAGCEAFLTNVQGKTLAHSFVFAGDGSLVLETVAGQADAILKHLDHYLVCERVTLDDRSQAWAELFLAGAESAPLLERLGIPLPGEARLSHQQVTLAGGAAALRRVDLTSSPGFLISTAAEELEPIWAALLAAGAVECGPEPFQAARLEAGFPQFGADISEGNLPQEVARDAQAISFVKGCYLGQETVARIDALGHVNKTLVGLRFDGSEIPAPGTELRGGEQILGHVTSAAYSPKWSSPLALGYVRRGSNSAGTRLTSTVGELQIVDLR